MLQLVSAASSGATPKLSSATASATRSTRASPGSRVTQRTWRRTSHSTAPRHTPVRPRQALPAQTSAQARPAPMPTGCTRGSFPASRQAQRRSFQAENRDSEMTRDTGGGTAVIKLPAAGFPYGKRKGAATPSIPAIETRRRRTRPPLPMKTAAHPGPEIELAPPPVCSAAGTLHLRLEFDGPRTRKGTADQHRQQRRQRDETSVTMRHTERQGSMARTADISDLHAGRPAAGQERCRRRHRTIFLHPPITLKGADRVKQQQPDARQPPAPSRSGRRRTQPHSSQNPIRRPAALQHRRTRALPPETQPRTKRGQQCHPGRPRRPAVSGRDPGRGRRPAARGDGRPAPGPARLARRPPLHPTRLLPRDRLLTLDKRLEGAAARPVVVPETAREE